MKAKYIRTDKEYLPKKLREFADLLEKDYWGNLYEVLEDMAFQWSTHHEKLKAIIKYMSAKQVAEWGRFKDAEEKILKDKPK